MRRAALALIILFVLLLGGAVVVALMATRQTQPAPPVVYKPVPATQRMLTSGPVVGALHPVGAHAWLGIPYAAPPVGELRWKAPRLPEPWTEVRKTVAHGPMCPQYSSPLSGQSPEATEHEPVGEEDCLYLSLWAPPFLTQEVPRGDQRLPVMLWIHGGGNSIGHGGNVDAARLAAEHGLIVVSINYRLGPMGWFRHPALAPEGAGEPGSDGVDGGVAAPDAGLDPDAGLVQADAGVGALAQGDGPPDAWTPMDASGNYGYLDMIAALRWVGANIEAFGGDPHRITIFGESAGGSNVLALMLSPLARGLFQGAIVQSGGFGIAPTHLGDHDRDAEPPGHRFGGPEVVNALLVADGKAADRQAARALQREMSRQEIAEYLRGKEAAEILGVFETRFGGMISFPSGFGDGHVLPARPAPAAELFEDAELFARVPVMLGTNRDEQKLFMVRNPQYVQRRLGLFPVIKDKPGYMRFARYTSDAWKVRGADDLARAMSAAGHAPVHVYRFDWDEEASVMGFDLSEALGAAHGLEIAFVMGRFSGGALSASYLYDEARIPARDALSNAMMSYWANFAHTGKPGRGRDGKLPEWTAWGAGGKHMLVLDTEADGGIRMSDEQLTYVMLKQRLLEDTSFDDARAHCAMYARLFHGNEQQWDQAEYEALSGGACKDVDPTEIDW